MMFMFIYGPMVLSYSIFACLIWDKVKAFYKVWIKKRWVKTMFDEVLGKGSITEKSGDVYLLQDASERHRTDWGFKFEGHLLEVIFNHDTFVYFPSSKQKEDIRKKLIKYALKT